MAEHLITDETVRSNLQAAYAAQQWPQAYAIVLNYITTTSDPIFTPELKFWFQGAIEINSDAGTPISEFIRTYTRTSFDLLGETLSDAQLQQISNDIALSVIRDIIGLNTESDPADDWRVPDLQTIVSNDVAGVLGFNGGDRPLVAWGGTAFGETKLGLNGWMDDAIQTGDDLRIFFRATAKASAAALTAMVGSGDFDLMSDDDVERLVAAITEITLWVENYARSGLMFNEERLFDEILEDHRDDILNLLKGAALGIADPSSTDFAALSDALDGSLLGLLHDLAGLISPDVTTAAILQASTDGVGLLIGRDVGDAIVGNGAANMVFAEDGDDTLAGGDGDDTLFGGAGKDELTGGAGDDRFIIEGNDTIIDPEMGDRVGFLDAEFYIPVWLYGGERAGGESNGEEGRPEYTRSAASYIEETSNGTVTYDWSADSNSLVITLPDGSNTTVQNWKNGEAGITLKEADDEKFDNSEEAMCPLVLDLDGDGIELTDLSRSRTYFDLDEDGFAERTGWVSPDDGLLALDGNSNGTIDDVSELFGVGGFASRDDFGEDAGSLPSGFDKLRALDANLDGVIDAADSVFTDLRVWRDLNGDGISQSGELQTLESLGIASLSLTSTQDLVEQGENFLSDFGSYTRTDSTTADMVDVWFSFDAQMTKYLGEVDIDPATDGLPALRGYGETKDLVVAMSEDAQLLTMVSDLQDLTVADAASLADRAEAILFRWHGVDAVDPQSRGQFADGQWLTALEKVCGTPWENHNDLPTPANYNAGSQAAEAWRDYMADMTVRLLAQSPMGQVLFPGLAYVGMAFVTLPDEVSLTDTIANLTAHSPSDGVAKLQYWHSMILVLDALYPEFKGTFEEEYEGQYEEQFIAAIETGLAADGVAYDYDQLRGGDLGGDGDDVLIGIGSTPDSGVIALLVGGAGNDTYVVGSDTWDAGVDVVVEGANAGTDTVKSWESYVLGANLENLTLLGTDAINGTGNELDNVLTGNAAKNTLTGGLGDDLYFVQNTSDVVVEAASEGADAVISSVTYTIGANVETLTLSGSANINGTGNAGANLLTGNTGNNVLDGGAGADTLVGGLGDDSYVADASDSIVENSGEGSDTVRASASFDLGTVANIENLTLLGSSAIDGTGTSGANVLTGNSGANDLAGLAGDDTINAGSGNDTIAGGGGADTIDLGSGGDRLIYINVLDAGDIVSGFATSGTGQDKVDLDALFDALNGGIAGASRAGRVQLVDTGDDVELRIDTAGGTGAGDGVGDVALMTFAGLASASGLSVGTGSGDDIQIGSA